MNNSINFSESESRKPENKTNKELLDILSQYKLDKEGNFIDWRKFFSNLNLEQLLEFYNYCGGATFKNKLKQKDKQHSILFFQKFIEQLIKNIEIYDSLEKKVNLYFDKGISYWDILFKINILKSYLSKLNPDYKINKQIEQDIIKYKANTTRMGKKNYWPDIIGKLKTKKDIINYYKKQNTRFNQFYNISDKINSISFFLALYNKFLRYKEDKKVEKYLKTLKTYLIKLGYFQGENKLEYKVSNWKSNLEKIETENDLKTMYKKLVDWKFFSVKLKTNEKKYIEYLNILVNKLITIYENKGQNPLTNIAIYTILKYKDLLTNEQIEKLNSMIYFKEKEISKRKKREQEYLKGIENLKTKEDIKLYYKSLVSWKLFSIKLKNNPEKYKNYLLSFVDKIILFYKENGISPLAKLSIGNILKYKDLLTNKQINDLENILSSFKNKPTTRKKIKKIKKTKEELIKNIFDTKKTSEEKEPEKEKTSNTKQENIINKQIILNKLKLKQFYRQAFKELSENIKNISFTDKEKNELIKILKLNDILKIYNYLKLNDEQIKYIITKYFFGYEVILIDEENNKNLLKLVKKVIKSYKDNEQEQIKEKLAKLGISI